VCVMCECLYLTKPKVGLKNEYLSFYKEWVESGEDMVPWVIQKDPRNFEEMVQFLIDNSEGVDLPEGLVPDSTYWLIDHNERILGAVNIRHQLKIFYVIVVVILDMVFVRQRDERVMLRNY